MPGERAGGAEADHARGVVELVVGERHDEHGATGAEGLAGGADAALMDHGGGVGENPAVREIVPRKHGRREVGRRWVGAEEEEGAPAELVRGAGAVPIEVAGELDGGGAQREDDGRRARRQKRSHGRRERRRSGGAGFLFVEKTETRLERVRRPIGLRWLEERGEEREVELR